MQVYFHPGKKEDWLLWLEIHLVHIFHDQIKCWCFTKSILLSLSFAMLQMGSNRWPGIKSFVVFTWYAKASEVCLCGLWCNRVPGKNYCCSSVVLYITLTIATICWEPGHSPLSFFFPSSHQISVKMISYTYGLNTTNKAKMNAENQQRNILVGSETLSRNCYLFSVFKLSKQMSGDTQKLYM